MTLIITAIFAVIATILRFALPHSVTQRFHLGFLALMYWGASLMWSVGGIFCLMEGEPFVELADAAVMADDAMLGACVVILGLIVWGVVCFVKRNNDKAVSSAAA